VGKCSCLLKVYCFRRKVRFCGKKFLTADFSLDTIHRMEEFSENKDPEIADELKDPAEDEVVWLPFGPELGTGFFKHQNYLTLVLGSWGFSGNEVMVIIAMSSWLSPKSSLVKVSRKWLAWRANVTLPTVDVVLDKMVKRGLRVVSKGVGRSASEYDLTDFINRARDIARNGALL